MSCSRARTRRPRRPSWRRGARQSTAARAASSRRGRARLYGLRFAQDDEVMRPRQLSHQWCDVRAPAVGFVKLPHAEEVRACVAARAGVAPRERRGELRHHAVAPLRARDLRADVRAELSVVSHQLRVDRLVRPPPRRLHERDDFGEATIAARVDGRAAQRLLHERRRRWRSGARLRAAGRLHAPLGRSRSSSSSGPVMRLQSIGSSVQ